MPANSPKQTKRWREQEFLGAKALNHDTGEVTDLGDIIAMVPQQQRRKTARREIKFAMIEIEAMPKLKMSKGEWTLFWTVVRHTDREWGVSRIQTSELAEAMGWSAPNTSRAISRLVARAILIRERAGVLRVNPLLLSRKSVDKWEVDMETAPKIDWEGSDA